MALQHNFTDNTGVQHKKAYTRVRELHFQKHAEGHGDEEEPRQFYPTVHWGTYHNEAARNNTKAPLRAFPNWIPNLERGDDEAGYAEQENVKQKVNELTQALYELAKVDLNQFENAEDI